MPSDTQLKLRFCTGCLGDSQRDSVRSVRHALSGNGLADKVLLECIDDLAPCEKPVTMTLQMAGGASYVFAGVDPKSDAADIAATCAAYLTHEDGWIEDARPCGRLRHCLTVRVPA